MSMTYLLLIVAGVVGLLAPVVILSPLLLILCFTAVGSWRSKKKGRNKIADIVHLNVGKWNIFTVLLRELYMYVCLFSFCRRLC